MRAVGISDANWNTMPDGLVSADPRNEAVVLEGSAPMTPERIRVVPIRGRDKTIRAYALISEADAERVLSHRWSLNGTGYAWRNAYLETPKHVYLHRFLMGCAPNDGLHVDHINRDRLDNRRSNLRIGTPAEGRQNTPLLSGRYRGVGFDRSRGLWQAQAQLGRRHYFLGRYRTEEDAGAAAREWRLAHMPFTVEDIA